MRAKLVLPMPGLPTNSRLGISFWAAYPVMRFFTSASRHNSPIECGRYFSIHKLLKLSILFFYSLGSNSRSFANAHALACILFYFLYFSHVFYLPELPNPLSPRSDCAAAPNLTSGVMMGYSTNCAMRSPFLTK